MSGAFGCLLLGEECEATRLGDAAQVRGKEAAGERSNSRRLAGQSLVHWVLRRASEAQQLRGLVVSARPEHASAAFQQALPGNVCLHVSDAPDAWTRLLDCQQWLEKQRREAVTGFVQLRLDCPFVDPCLLDRLVISADREAQADYATYRSAREGAVVHAQIGLMAEYLRVETLRRWNGLAPAGESRRNPGQFLAGRPDEFHIRLLALPALLDRDDLRLSVRHVDDWEHAEQIVEALGHDQLDWQRIVSLLDTQPALRERMAALNDHERQGQRHSAAATLR